MAITISNVHHTETQNLTTRVIPPGRRWTDEESQLLGSLMIRARSGDLEARDRAWTLLQGAVEVRVAWERRQFNLTDDAADWSDVEQDLWFDFLKMCGRYNPDQGDAARYVLGMLKFRVRDARRRYCPKHMALPMIDQEFGFGARDRGLADVLDSISIDQRTRELTERERIALLRWAIDGYTDQETADHCGVSLKTIRRARTSGAAKIRARGPDTAPSSFASIPKE